MKTNVRKQIIKPDFEEMAEGFQRAPIRQILSLDLTDLQRNILLNFFSHDYEKWKLSISGISHSFNKYKNRDDVRKCLKQLEALYYLIITDDSYEVNIKKINEDFNILNIKKKMDKLLKTDSLATSKGGSLATSKGGSLATTKTDSLDTTNKRIINEIYKGNKINEITALRTAGVTPSHPDNFEKPDVEKSVGYAVGNNKENSQKMEKITETTPNEFAGVFEENKAIVNNTKMNKPLEKYEFTYQVSYLESVYNAYTSRKQTSLSKYDFCKMLDTSMKRDNWVVLENQMTIDYVDAEISKLGNPN